MPFEPLDPALYREIVRRALAEDLGWGDVTTEATVAAELRAPRRASSPSAPACIAGLDVAAEAFRQLDPAVDVHAAASATATAASRATIVAEVRGSAAAMLTAERTALNFLQRLSGIATLTRRFVDAAGGRITILDTRKTTPTLRALEKYAVRAGGGTNHRGGLDDGILIKDNHIRLAGGVERSGAADEGRRPGDADRGRGAEPRAGGRGARGRRGHHPARQPVAPTRSARRVARIAGRAKIEISGGVTLDRMPELAATGADYVSVGALTHSAAAVDLSFEIEPDV